MKKFVYLLVSFLIFNCCACALELQGGVKYNVDSAREYVREGQKDTTQISGPFVFRAENTDKVIYSYNNSGMVIGITVRYINEPTVGYIYGRDKTLIYVDKYDKPTDIYPHRGYRYNIDGELVLTSLSVSENEHFRFTPEGALLAHSINGVIYDENGQVIGKGEEVK